MECESCNKLRVENYRLRDENKKLLRTLEAVYKDIRDLRRVMEEARRRGE